MPTEVIATYGTTAALFNCGSNDNYKVWDVDSLNTLKSLQKQNDMLTFLISWIKSPLVNTWTLCDYHKTIKDDIQNWIQSLIISVAELQCEVNSLPFNSFTWILWQWLSNIEPIKHGIEKLILTQIKLKTLNFQVTLNFSYQWKTKKTTRSKNTFLGCCVC